MPHIILLYYIHQSSKCNLAVYIPNGSTGNLLISTHFTILTIPHTTRNQLRIFVICKYIFEKQFNIRIEWIMPIQHTLRKYYVLFKLIYHTDNLDMPLLQVQSLRRGICPPRLQVYTLFTVVEQMTCYFPYRYFGRRHHNFSWINFISFLYTVNCISQS